jgi:negative regulator of sigma E activity
VLAAAAAAAVVVVAVAVVVVVAAAAVSASAPSMSMHCASQKDNFQLTLKLTFRKQFFIYMAEDIKR